MKSVSFIQQIALFKMKQYINTVWSKRKSLVSNVCSVSSKSRKKFRINTPVLSTVQTYIFSYVQCMPDGNSSIIRKFHVNWRDLTFFMKTGWSDRETNSFYFNHFFILEHGVYDGTCKLTFYVKSGVLTVIIRKLILPGVSARRLAN